MPSVFTLIGSAWEFFRKQPALHFATIWLIFLPELLMNFLGTLVPDPFDPAMSVSILSSQRQSMMLGVLIATLLLWVLTMWGVACILVIGKRQLQKSAGRNRTSFKAVRAQARGFVLPLVLTVIIRTGMILVWSLPAAAVFIILLFSDILSPLLPAPPAGNDQQTMLAHLSALFGLSTLLSLPFLLPAVLYAIRTAFYQIITVCEDLPYRPALTRSAGIVRGRTGRVFLWLAGIGITLFLPVFALSLIFSRFLPQNFLAAEIAGLAILSAAQSFSIVLLTLSMILLYKHLRPRE